MIAAAVLLLTGVLFNRDLVVSMGTKPADPSLVPVVLSFTMVFFAPLLTMRLFAEEQREGTLELLLTAPVSDGSIVFGKFLGAWFYYSAAAAADLPLPVHPDSDHRARSRSRRSAPISASGSTAARRWRSA